MAGDVQRTVAFTLTVIFAVHVFALLAARLTVGSLSDRTEPITRESIWRSLRPSAGLPSDTRPVSLALVLSVAATLALAGLYLSLGSSVLGNVPGEAAPADQRGEVFVTMYIVRYLAFSVPALAAGLAAEQFGLKPTAVTYGVAEVALVLMTTILGQVRRRRRADGAGRSQAQRGVEVD